MVSGQRAQSAAECNALLMQSERPDSEGTKCRASLAGVAGEGEGEGEGEGVCDGDGAQVLDETSTRRIIADDPRARRTNGIQIHILELLRSQCESSK